MGLRTELKLEEGDDCGYPNNTQIKRLKRHGGDCPTTVITDKTPEKIIMTVPLSISTANLGQVVARDIADWVSRSSSIRHREVKQRKGHTARPLNSFMLYRFAYIKKARAWCRQNKEQVLSQVIAASWKMEPIEVRRCYERYAKIERSNHAKAHPTYKFSPNRARLAGATKKKLSLRERCSDHQRNSQSMPVSEYETVNKDTCSNMVEYLNSSGSSLAMHNAWQPKLLETSMALPHYQSQQCYKSGGDHSFAYHADKVSHAMTVVTEDNCDPSVSHYAQMSTYYCMCFSCMFLPQPRVLYDAMYSGYEPMAMMPQALPSVLPVHTYSTPSSYHDESSLSAWHLSSYGTL